MIELSRQFGRYSYHSVAALLNDAGWHVSEKRVERFSRREGLEAPVKRAKRCRLWLKDGFCARLKPQQTFSTPFRDLFILRVVPAFIRSDNGHERMAKIARN